MTARVLNTTFGAAANRRGFLCTLGGAAAATSLGHPASAKRKNHHTKKPNTPKGSTVTKSFANPNAIAINTFGSATPFLR